MIISYTKKDFYLVKDKLKGNLSEDVFSIIKNISCKSKYFNKKKKYDNRWRSSKPIIGKPAKTDEEKVNREINSNLNKISNDNFGVIMNKIKTLISKNNKDSIIEVAVNNIFQTAILQPVYCPLYVKVCKYFIEKNDNAKNIINKWCINYNNMINKNEDFTENTDDSTKIMYDKFCESIKNKRKQKGFTQFMGELYLQEIIDKNIIEKMNNMFIEKIDNTTSDDFDNIIKHIECFCTMITTITPKIKEFKDYTNIIKRFSKDKKIQPRYRFMFMDVYDKLSLNVV